MHQHGNWDKPILCVSIYLNIYIYIHTYILVNEFDYVSIYMFIIFSTCCSVPAPPAGNAELTISMLKAVRPTPRAAWVHILPQARCSRPGFSDSEEQWISRRKSSSEALLFTLPKSRCSLQSRRTLFWNELFGQSCTFFPCYRTSAL